MACFSRRRSRSARWPPDTSDWPGAISRCRVWGQLSYGILQMLGFDLDAMAYMSVGLGAKPVRSRGFDGVLGGLHSWCHLTTGQIRRMPSKRYGGATPARLASATLSASTAWWWRGILLVGVLGILTIGIATLRGSTVKIGLLLAEATLHSLAELLGIRHLAVRGGGGRVPSCRVCVWPSSCRCGVEAGAGIVLARRPLRSECGDRSRYITRALACDFNVASAVG